MEHQHTLNSPQSIQRSRERRSTTHQQLLGLQKKPLEVSSPEDDQEKEADEVARKVVDGQSTTIHGTGGTLNRKSDTPLLQMKCVECEEREKKERAQSGKNGVEPNLLQMKCEKCKEEDEQGEIQRKESGQNMSAPEDLAGKLQQTKGGGQSLPDDVQKDFGGKMNADLGGVKIHTDSQSHEMNEQLGAKAFTHGDDIYFKKDNYNPGSNEGKLLLAHELTHTVQQKNGSTGKVQKHEDRSVLSLKTPWDGTIVDGADVGFHETPGSGNNIYPSFTEGDAVTVIGVGKNNWLHVSRISEGDKQTGYVDWRHVKPKAGPKKKEKKPDETENRNVELAKYKALKIKLGTLDDLTISGSSFTVQSDLKILQKKISILRSALKDAGPLEISEADGAMIQSKISPLAKAIGALPLTGFTGHQQTIAGFATYSFVGPAGAAALEAFLVALEAVIAAVLWEVILIVLIIVAIVLLIVYVIEHFDEIIQAIKEALEKAADLAICTLLYEQCVTRRTGNVPCHVCLQNCIVQDGAWPFQMCPIP